MADLHSLVDHIYYENRRDYTHVEGDVAYLDGTPLRRPFEMPRTQRVIAIIIVIIAIVIGFMFLNNTVFQAMRETAQAEEMLEANLARQASIETIPPMAQFIKMSDDDIRANLQEAGYNVYDASDPEDPTNMVLYKLPSDVSVEEAAGMYAKGIGSLSAAQAAKILVGSWYLNADRNGWTSMVVRYADFSTGDPEVAVQNALAKEGFDPQAITESGEDDSGNTFSSGTLDADGTACSWKISALPLDEMYSVSGLPEEACYVGIRVTIL
ncbi:MAG: teichoic acid transporter [Eggerthellaceae bacterium]|nr:teichoic acid transporter [Eggerthellaceae bacterium]